MTKSFFKDINCWDDFVNKLSGLNNTEKGNAFELLTKLYFKTNPLYLDYDDVWLLKEVPQKELDNLKISRQDLGIDLIAKKGKEYHAIQCKYHGDKNKLEERHAYGDIAKDIYDKYYSIEMKREDDIVNQLQQPVIEISNLNNFINKSLDFSNNLDRYWKKSNITYKKKIQNTVFGSKIYLDGKKNKYLTENYSPIFKLIDSYSGDYYVKEKGPNNKNIEKSSLVAGARLELTTFGL